MHTCMRLHVRARAIKIAQAPSYAHQHTVGKRRSGPTKVMDIIVNSLYSNKDVFLRELVSNAADACDKKRFIALTEGDRTVCVFAQVSPKTSLSVALREPYHDACMMLSAIHLPACMRTIQLSLSHLSLSLCFCSSIYIRSCRWNCHCAGTFPQKCTPGYSPAT